MMQTMELKVWVDNVQRIVCGVTDNTSCEDVVIALAHATGKTGRFCLVEKWRENERVLSPSEHPTTLLSKWGKYANDVQFILKQTEQLQQHHPPHRHHGRHQHNHHQAPPQNVRKALVSQGGQVLQEDKPPSYDESRQRLASGVSSRCYLSEPGGGDRDSSPDCSSSSDAQLTDSALSQPRSRHKELVKLVNAQNERLRIQRQQLDKCDLAVQFEEKKEREHTRHAALLSTEMEKLKSTDRKQEGEISELSQYNWDIIKQQAIQTHKTIQAEISLVKCKIENCESEICQTEKKCEKLAEDKELEKAIQKKVESDLQKWETEAKEKCTELKKQLIAQENVIEEELKEKQNVESEISQVSKAVEEKRNCTKELLDQMREANMECFRLTEMVNNLSRDDVFNTRWNKAGGGSASRSRVGVGGRNSDGIWV